MRRHRGIGVLETIVVVGLVTGAGMAWKYISDVKKSGKKEAVLEMHEAQGEVEKAVSGQYKEYQVHQRELDMEMDKMEKAGVSERELNEKAFEKWGD